MGSPGVRYRTVHPDVDIASAKEICAQLIPERVVVEGENIEASLTEEDKNSLLEDLSYWETRSAVSLAEDVLERRWGERIADWAENIWTSVSVTPTGRTVDFAKLLNIGLNGVIAEARNEIDILKVSDAKGLHKWQFLQAAIIACQAVITFARRHAGLARELNRVRRNGITGQALIKNLGELYYQHNMRDWIDRRGLQIEEQPTPVIVCSEGLA